MAGEDVRTIKQFIEEAVVLWLKTAKHTVVAATDRSVPKKPDEADPYEPFHNQIRKDLKLKLKEAAYQRELIGHPVRTLVAFVDEAIVRWLTTQDEFSNKGLSQFA